MAELKVVSSGGGVQSTALLVLAARGEIDYRCFVFANVGEDSESKSTLRYMAEHGIPYAQKHGIDYVEVRRLARDGSTFPSIRQHLLSGRRSIVIPVRMANGAPGNRQCTPDWKIKVVTRYCRDHGATPEHPARVAVGFSTDEWTRAGRRWESGIETVEYPLLGLGLDRAACAQLILSAGLPVPPKSACSFCPFRLPDDFRRMAVEDPDEFKQVCALEDSINEKRRWLGKDSVWFTRFARPLRDVVAMAGHQLSLDLYQEDEGYRCGDVCDT